jgi:RNA polymerase sigma-70 factor (ECF subfamily)
MVQHASVRTDVGIGVGVVRARPAVRLVKGGSPAGTGDGWFADAELADLVDQALTGERRAVERLLVRIQPLVLRYCRARVGSRERILVSADDIAQEVCLAVVGALGKYQYESSSFLAFVYGIAAHKVADARRHAVRNKSDVVPELPDRPALDDGPEQRAVNGEMIQHITQLLRLLPDRQREILVLRVAVGMSAEETAAAVGSTPGAVRVAQHRALARMREMVAAAVES